MPPSLPPDYFDNLYADKADPWQIATGWYEQRKRALVMAALPAERYEVGFEPGCSNGELTVLLAQRCERIVAWDVADAAVENARSRTAGLPGVRIARGGLPGRWPTEGKADLVVLAEVGYYLDTADLDLAVDSAVDRLTDGGTLLAVHWRHDAPDYPLRGDDVHHRIGTHDRLVELAHYRDADFVLDVWTHGPTPSVAQQTGLL